ncbi:exonuclease 3'-5' domain-containing protein 2 isoform X1 [Scleropages formosus]|uniref:Exonuclease 3'-5' domain-containing protein 2 n=1 Tax=Scleropages formosus TaxID=113540 RepID=A0A8C9R373_SCLFO|nr:exonuclease 3'-5' domain-containing protein 2 isoform X1 [Scleropages formosus]XP_018582847.1 exonuclease 3'-5' domain-containing protein 2 isoform X1 [Scleropages formosus]
MSRQSIFTATVAAVLGATLGGLLFWRSLCVRRKRIAQSQTEPDSAQREKTTAVEHEVDAVPSGQPPPLSPSLMPVVPLLPSPEKLLEVLPVVVSSEDQWEELWPSLEKELSVYPVLGLDCEWVKTQCVSVKGKSGPVSLLQMASYTGRCALVRLPLIHSVGQSLPNSLVKILNDSRVLKVGVGCYEDGKRLARDYGLSLGCTVDLRYLVIRQRQMGLSNGLSLKSLAADLLNVPLDKSLELRCSDWEADKLTLEQVTYAARDAQVSIALFFHLLGLNSSLSSRSDDVFSQMLSRCHGLVDVPFCGRGLEEGEEKSLDGERRRRSRRNTSDSSGSGSVSGDQQVPDPRKNRRKPLGVGYSARKSPLYDNCFLHAPDGQPLCTCDKKKAKWYLDKGIGELLSEDPFIVRLKFEPSGRPDSQQDYYLTAKENLCVVCGKTDSYIRKNIVPHEYRRHFPAEMKDHNSHDILLLCTSCHAASNVHDGMLKQQLAEEFGAPLGCEEGVRLLEDSDRRRVRSAARALLTASDSLPQARRKELEDLIKTFFGQEQQEITTEMLQKAVGLETRIFNQSYVPHGLKVVRAYAERGLRGLMELERRWRQHFLSAMKPRHLHPLWSVNHNHAKFLRKYGEDLPIQLN